MHAIRADCLLNLKPDAITTHSPTRAVIENIARFTNVLKHAMLKHAMLTLGRL